MKSLEEVARELGLTREEVRKEEQAALRKLRRLAPEHLRELMQALQDSRDRMEEAEVSAQHTRPGKRGWYRNRRGG